ncbi:unnamed protein product, partial [Didymodactylos carnosus]
MFSKRCPEPNYEQYPNHYFPNMPICTLIEHQNSCNHCLIEVMQRQIDEYFKTVSASISNLRLNIEKLEQQHSNDKLDSLIDEMAKNYVEVSNSNSTHMMDYLHNSDAEQASQFSSDSGIEREDVSRHFESMLAEMNMHGDMNEIDGAANSMSGAEDDDDDDDNDGIDLIRIEDVEEEVVWLSFSNETIHISNEQCACTTSKENDEKVVQEGSESTLLVSAQVVLRIFLNFLGRNEQITETYSSSFISNNDIQNEIIDKGHRTSTDHEENAFSPKQIDKRKLDAENYSVMKRSRVVEVLKTFDTSSIEHKPMNRKSLRSKEIQQTTPGDRYNLRRRESLPKFDRRTSYEKGEQLCVALSTNLTFTEQQLNSLKDLGFQLVDGNSQVDVFVANSVGGTKEFFACLARGVPIVNSLWIDAVLKTRKTQPFAKFCLKDKYNEKRYNFKLKESIRRAKLEGIFNDYKVYCTNETVQSLKNLLVTAGAEVIDTYNNPSNDLLIVVAQKQKENYEDLRKFGYNVVSEKWVLFAILRQQLDLDT